MSAQRREAEQFTMPLPVMLAKSTLGQLRAERDALIERLLVLAGHRNQVVSIPRERLEQIACVAVCGTTWSEEVQMDWFMPNSTVAKWARSLPSRRWRERLHSLRALGERIVIAEMQAAPNAKRLSVLPPPRIRPRRSRRHSFLNSQPTQGPKDMAKKLDPQIKQDRAELRERRTQLRQLINAHKAAVKGHTKARAELETRIAIITGRLTK